MGSTWIGVDVSKRTFVAARRIEKGFETRQFSNDVEGFVAFLSWLEPTVDVVIAMESSGPYWQALAFWLESLERPIPYAVVNPLRVRRFAEASDERSKDDWIDAAVIVHFAETFEPEPEIVKPSIYREMRAIWRYQLTLVLMREELRDRRDKMFADPHTPKHLAVGIERLLADFDEQVRELERDCVERLRNDPALHQTYRLLLSIPGIGPKTALALITEYGPRLTLANSRQLTSYAGLEPIRFQSGTSVMHPPHISKQGNWRLRRALYLAALTATRHNSKIVDFYKRKRSAGLSSMASLLAASRKLLELVAGVLRSQKPFDKNYGRA